MKKHERAEPTREAKVLFRRAKKRIDKILSLIWEYNQIQGTLQGMGYVADPQWAGDGGSSLPLLELIGNAIGGGMYSVKDSADLDQFLEMGPIAPKTRRMRKLGAK